MKYGVYVVRDIKTCFMTPTIDLNDLSAKRNFEHACMNEDSLMHSHPEDYQLFRIGTYLSDDGVIDSLDVPELIADACQFDIFV